MPSSSSSSLGGGHRIGAAHVDRDVFALVGPCHHRVDAGVGGDDDPDRPQPLAAARRRQQNAQLVAVLRAAVLAARAERRRDRLDLVRRGAELAQDRRDRVALLEHDGALVPGIAAGRLGGGLRQQGDVLGHDPRLEAGIRIVLAFGRRVGHRRDRAGDQSRLLAGVAVPVGSVAHPRDDLVEPQHGGDLRPRQDGGEIAGEERYFRVGLGAGIFGGDRRACRLRQHLHAH